MVGFAFFIGFIICVCAIPFVLYLHDSRKLNRTFESLAARYSGRFEKGSVWNDPILQFRTNGAPACLDYFGQRKSVFTRFTTNWRDSKLGCRVQKKDLVVNLRNRLFFRRAVKSGDPQFDDLFFVSGTVPDKIRGLLTPAVRCYLSAFRIAGPYSRYGPPVVVIKRGELAIMVEGKLTSEDTLRPFVDMSLQLLDVMLSVTADGIRFVEFEFDSIITGNGRCSVCGEPQSDREIVYCSVCQTPHHRECWLYTGRCSVYGCASTTYIELGNGPKKGARRMVSYARR